MTTQLELIPFFREPFRLTVAEACGFVWRHHLSTKASAGQRWSNLAAISHPESMGRVHLYALMDIHVEKHMALCRAGVIGRKPAGDTKIRHDLNTLVLVLNKVRKWKRKGYELDGFKFAKIQLVDPVDLFADIKRPKFNKRRRVTLPNEFARITEHADLDLTKLVEGLIDTGARLEDAIIWEPKHYNPYTDQIEWTQLKTGKFQCLPSSERVRGHFMEAKIMNWKFVYNSINLRARWERVRKIARIKDLHIGHDFRKTTYNEGRKLTKSSDVGRQLMGHTSNRTGDDYYYVEEREDLKPVVNFIENKFISRRTELVLPSRKKRLTLQPDPM